MVVHQAVCMADPVVAFFDMLKGVQKVGAILVALEDGFLFITARGDVIDSAGVFYAERTGHEARLSEVNRKVKHYRPDPKMP